MTEEKAAAASTSSKPSEGYVKPQDVLSPKDRVNKVLKVLYDGKEDNLAVAILDYSHGNGNRSEAVAIRWNGSKEDPLGFPSVRQYPVWFLVPDELASTIEFLATQKFPFKLPLESSQAEKVMSMFGNRFSTESLMKELKHRGFKVTLEM